MASLRDIAIRKESYNVAPSRIIRRAGWNPRFDFGDLSEIKATMAPADGSKEGRFYEHKPLLVRRVGDDFEIIDGDRRFTVVEKLVKAGVKFTAGIPVVIASKDMDDVEGLIETLTANNGKNLLPLEEAAAFKRLLDMDVTPKLKPRDIAERVGKAEAHVRATLALLDADESVREALTSKKINSTTAKNIAVKARASKETQKALVAKAAGAKGKAAKKAVKEEIRTTSKRAIKAKDGLTPLRPAQIAVALNQISKAITVGLKDVGIAEKALMTELKNDDKLALAFHLGAQAAMLAASGAENTPYVV